MGNACSSDDSVAVAEPLPNPPPAEGAAPAEEKKEEKKDVAKKPAAAAAAAAAPSDEDKAWIKSVRIVFVLGGPGSGKGTQCLKIKEVFGFTHLSAGDLLRKEVASGSERGQECDKLMKEGKLVPVEVTLDLLRDAMKAEIEGKPADSPARTFLIDGFPREQSQAAAFRSKFGRDCDYVLYFECSEDAMKQRILKRGETSGRADDNEATIVKRLQTFTKQILPVVKHYQKGKKLRRVNAEFAVEQVSLATERLIREEIVNTSTVVFVLGGPGSGKGTQCVRLAEKFGYKHLSTGDLLRAEVAAETELGKRCKEIMANGQLVSVSDTLELLENAMLASATTAKGFLIDGYPRESPQVAAFEKKFNRLCNFALYFECSEAVMEERILSRGQTSGRADDNADAAKKRLATFRAQTLPVVQALEKKKLVKKINAERPVDEVFADAVKAFPAASA